MPVPVARFPVRAPAHPVQKCHKSEAVEQQAAPISPSGLPPSFGTREEWIKSLPSWRRTKPRRIWEDDMYLPSDAESKLRTKYTSAIVPVEEPSTEVLDIGPDFDEDRFLSQIICDPDAEMSSANDYHKWTCEAVDFDPSATMSPAYEDESPGADVCSSPIQPLTPFGDYVDRAIAKAQAMPQQTGNGKTRSGVGNHFAQEIQQSYQPTETMLHSHVTSQPEVKSQAETVATPSATDSYKKLAHPLSEWIADYVWKVCTTDPIVKPTALTAPVYRSTPPSYLAGAVHSLLLSTLLQPSAVFLALRFIVILPVYLGQASLKPDQVKELRFRQELLGDAAGLDRGNTEANAPFHLIVLGCMLANKWLDDHTFSNRTWHTVSNIPLESINKLEALALDIFSYDLSISRKDWCTWLSQILAYHLSLSTFQPISRPSTNPHMIIRKAIEEIMQAPGFKEASAPKSFMLPLDSEPVFLGLERRRQEKAASEREMDVADAAYDDIDLDEDGPLREEYIPRRRISGASSSSRSSSSSGRSIDDNVAKPQAPSFSSKGWQPKPMIGDKPLPPPAKWSPAGDEPILRERNGNIMQPSHMLVQPPQYQYPAYHHPSYESAGYLMQWTTTPHGNYAPPKLGYASYDSAASYQGLPPPGIGYMPFIGAPPLSHSRSQSLVDPQHSQHRPRTYSQSRFEYRCSDLRSTVNRPITNPASVGGGWTPSSGQYAYPGAFATDFQSSWLRA